MGALLLAGKAAAAAPEPEFPTNAVILVDGMAVDLLNPAPRYGDTILRIPSLSMDSRVPDRHVSFRSIEDLPRSPMDLEFAQRHLAQAEQYLKDSNLTKAMFELRDGLSYNPLDPRLLSRAAVLAAERKDYDRAASYFKRYLELRPNDLSHAAAYASVLVRMSRLDEADAVLKIAEGLNPDFMPVQFSRACLQLIREQRNLPREFWLRRSIDEIQIVAQWLKTDRAELLRVMGPDALDRLADIALGTGTLRSLDEIAELLGRAREARAKNDCKAALAHWRKAGTLGVDGFGLSAAQAEAAESSGDVDLALRLWSDLSRRFNNWPQAWLSYAHVLLRTGHFDQALQAARRAKELAPDAFVIDFVVASGHALKGEMPEAQKLFNELVMRHPAEFKKWLESDPVFEAAVNKMPNHAAILRQLEIPPENQ